MPTSTPLPEHPCDARCAARQGLGAFRCSRIVAAGATNLEGTVGRSGFLRGLGALAGAATIGSAAGALGGWFSPVAGAMAAGTPALGKSTHAASGAGLWLGNARALTPAQALTYKDPGSGDPALLMRLTSGQYVSYDAGCTHGTCTVAYDTKRRLMVCPCHGATFDPAHSAAVLVGPAKDPLYQLRIRVDPSGDVYYLDAPPGPRVNLLKPAPPYTGQTGDDGGEGGGSNGQGGEGDNSRIRPLHRSTKIRQSHPSAPVRRTTSKRDD